MQVEKMEVINSLKDKIARTDWIALRHITGETSTWANFSWEAWQTYRDTLRGLINEVEAAAGREVNPDTLNYPSRPTVPALAHTKMQEEIDAHAARLMDEYGILPPNEMTGIDV